jgi:hypothetical protein
MSRNLVSIIGEDDSVRENENRNRLSKTQPMKYEKSAFNLEFPVWLDQIH